MPCECVASCEETRISGEEMRKEEAIFTKSSREHRHLPGSIGGPRQWVLHTISAICGSRACSLGRVNPHSLLLSPDTGSPQGIAWSNPISAATPEMASLSHGLGGVRMKMDGLGRKLSQSVHDEWKIEGSEATVTHYPNSWTATVPLPLVNTVSRPSF